MNILAVIPARAGSKGLPGKNIRPFHGRPLLAWSVYVAAESDVVTRIIVSTDDPAAAAIGQAAGAHVPGLRPARLAGDTVPMLDVVLDLLERIGPAEPDAILLLQPTSPLRQADDLRGAVALLEQRPEADAVCAVTLSKQHPHWLQHIGTDQCLTPYLAAEEATRRQDLPPLYALNGALYLVRTSALRRERTFRPAQTLAWIMPENRSVDIDTELDFRLAELLFTPPSPPC